MPLSMPSDRFHTRASPVLPARNIAHVEQSEDNWCWAACITMVVGDRQCAVASRVLARTDCCLRPSACDVLLPLRQVKPAWDLWIGSGLSTASTFRPNALDQTELVAEVGRAPVQILDGSLLRSSPPMGGGHLMLVVDQVRLSPPTFRLFDPAEKAAGGGVKKVTHEALSLHFSWEASWADLD